MGAVISTPPRPCNDFVTEMTNGNEEIRRL
jgi:hypothetical protein